MKHTSGRKFNKIIRRVLSLTLCLSVSFTTLFVMDYDVANAETGQKKIGYQWERIYDNTQAAEWINTINNSKVRILIIYDDRFYVGREDSYDGSYYGKLLSNQIRTDLDTFISRKDFNTPIVEYGGHDGDNNCEKFKIHMTDAYGNPTNYWLYHENVIFPCVFKGLFTFRKSLNADKEDDEVAFTMTSDRWDAASFQFHIFNDCIKRSHFIQRNLEKYFNGKSLAELTEANQKKVMEYAARDIATIAKMYESAGDGSIEEIYEAMKGYEGTGEFTDEFYCPETKVDLDADISVRNVQESQRKEEFYHLEREWSGKVRYKINGQDCTYKQAMQALKVEGMDFSNAIIAAGLGALFGAAAITGGIMALVEYIKYSIVMGDRNYLMNTAKIYYNISGRLDTAWRIDGSEIYDSWSDEGDKASFKVYFGREVELPTLTEDYSVEVNETYIIEDIDIAAGVIVKVGQGATLVVRGQVVNEGTLDVYGNVVIEKGSVLTDELDPGTGAARKTHTGSSGTVYIKGHTILRPGSMMIVEEGAAHLQYKVTHFEINRDATYICDGAFISTAEIDCHGTFEIGPTGEAALGAYPLVDKAELGAVPQYLTNHTILDLVIAYKGSNEGLWLYSDGIMRVYGLLGIYRVNSDNPYTLSCYNGARIIGYEGAVSDFTPALSGIQYYEKYQEWH